MLLRRILRLAAEWGAIQSAPKIELLVGETRRERVVTPEEEVRYLAAEVESVSARFGDCHF